MFKLFHRIWLKLQLFHKFCDCSIKMSSYLPKYWGYSYPLAPDVSEHPLSITVGRHCNADLQFMGSFIHQFKRFGLIITFLLLVHQWYVTITDAKQSIHAKDRNNNSRMPQSVDLCWSCAIYIFLPKSIISPAAREVWLKLLLIFQLSQNY